jgi:hypothetical protein
MRRTPWPRLVVVAALTAGVVLLGLRFAEGRGATVLPIPLVSSLVVALIAAVVLTLGWNVRQYTRGRRPGLDPLLAARTVVLATASAYTGAVLTGWYGAHALLVLGDLDIAARRELAASTVPALVCTVGLAVVGLVVERWCEIRGDDDESGSDGGGAATGSPV